MEQPAASVAAWEFLVSRRAREEYGIDEAPTHGVDLAGVRLLAERINRHRTAAATPAPPIPAGQLNALRLIEEFLFRLIDGYRRRHGDAVVLDAFGWLEERFAADRVDDALALSVDLYPPNEVYRSGLDAEPYLAAGDARAKRLWSLERMVVLWLVQHNPAASSLADLFDDGELEDASGYRQMMASLRGFFARHPGIRGRVGDDADGDNFFDLLQTPSRERPDSLTAQLELLARVVQQHPEAFGIDPSELGLETMVESLKRGVDVLREEERPFFPGPGGGPPEPAPAEVLTFADLAEDEQRFTEDRDWMPELVLLAKNTLVWLDQLTRAWERPIHRLDEIPDEELDRMAEWGFTGLWLIGIFERSRASERIKQLCGNPEAAASAYSLCAYRVAEELGGDEALETLRKRAWKRRIRLACDMVPNHMGIDSEWLAERPDLFLSLPESPYPNYSFRGPELSTDPRYSLRIEDHYYDRTDAAVVFQRVDRGSGEVRYVYHGNDGTTMPWNDTAQLDYLNPETREAVIEVILDVARRFPVIRFDAAMTLARRHVQRLWYPAPGHGGAIPSRSEHGLPHEEFLRRMPNEFWREVVDRVA
ncbi:MAG: alpha-amylase, partial [Acidobacteria bacterium]|nr:alpha-amylase [Acidobacteriota bacterium]